MQPDNPNLDLLVEGVAAVADLLRASPGEPERPQVLARWRGFEARLNGAPPELPLAALVRRFELDGFEIQVVLVALAGHIEPRMPQVVADSGSDLFSRRVTVRLLLERFCEDPATRVEARRAFLPSARLVRQRIVALEAGEVGAGHGLLSRRVELTTPTVRFLLEEPELSESVARVARLEAAEVPLLNVILPREQLQQVRELVLQHARYRETLKHWGFEAVVPHGSGLTMLFSGPSGTGKTLLAQALATASGRPLLALSAADLPDAEGLDAVLRDLFAEAFMREAIVLIDECETLLGKGDRRKATVFNALEEFEGLLILITNHPEQLDDALERRIIFHLPFDLPPPELRQQIWEVHLPQDVPLEGELDLASLANRYDFTGGTIKNAILFAVNRALARSPKAPRLTMELLEEGCRSQLRYALEELTVRTSTHLRLRDLVLPDDAMRKVRQLIAACRNQSTVLNRWGFGRRLVTGKGITALFDGPPGTGKTYCAEIVAGELERSLYRVNIPEVVSKWVGETEKHIKAIFQQARVSHAMLLFDEADSLFSARVGETRSSNDRYANMEVNLLLQEIERFPGICILTTNFFGSLDKALVRRLQFRVTFEEPDEGQRLGIWQVLCPAEAPLAPDVDFAALSKRWALTGGMIKNALLRAAYTAADGDGVITGAILEDACRDEFQAAGKLPPAARRPGAAPASAEAARAPSPGPARPPGPAPR